MMLRKWGNDITTMDQLKPGETAIIRDLHASGATRRRLLDLGFSAESRVTCVGKSPFGDPAAYWIRGTVIALRKTDSRQIEVSGKGDGIWD